MKQNILTSWGRLYDTVHVKYSRLLALAVIWHYHACYAIHWLGGAVVGWLVGNRGRTVVQCVKTMNNCLWQNVFSWTCASYSLIFMSNSNSPTHGMAALMPKVLFSMTSQCCNNDIYNEHTGVPLATRKQLSWLHQGLTICMIQTVYKWSLWRDKSRHISIQTAHMRCSKIQHVW